MKHFLQINSNLRPRRDSAVAERLIRRLRYGYVSCSSTIYKPHRIITSERVLAIYADGNISQACTPATANSDRIDPHAIKAAMVRAFYCALENTARARRDGRYADGREHLNNARIIRQGIKE